VLGDGNTWGRYVRGNRSVAGVEIALVGWQDATGAVARHASVWATNVALEPAALRQLAALALDAADELDQLAG
jgi:hypothetical protein